MFKVRRILLIISCVAMIMSTAGVFATWKYAEGVPLPQSSDVNLSMAEFVYKPEDIVPGGNQHEATLGENHLALLQLILHEASYGLNATKKPIIHTYLEIPGDVVYCDQQTSGGNLKHLMIDSSTSTDRLYFVVLKISDTEYHTFTMRHSDLSKAIHTEIEVFKTVMEKDEKGVWSAPRSYEGTARVNAPGTVQRAIDVTSWKQSGI